VFFSTIANGIDDRFGLEIEALRPGLFLVVLGQFSFIATIATLVIAARLRKFDRSLEEAALNLGGSPLEVFLTITLPYLRPALIGSGVVALLISFENFNTTLMLVGSDPPLTITMYDRMREGSTPVLNAVSFFLMIGSSLLGLASILAQRERQGGRH
jgi:spermidine/putrescine transport system permease protein